MKKRKLGIIGGSGLYKMQGFEKTKWKKIKTLWGNPSDEILIAKLNGEEISEMAFTNPLFKSDPSYMEKINRNMIKKMNKEIKKPTS